MKKFLLFLSVFLIGLPVVVSASATGTIDSVRKYAWSDEIGWINFGCANCNVQVADAAITGYAWSENYGWINLNPTQSGVKNTLGALSGYAWGESAGWINFTGVFINSSGNFTGVATGDTVGNINFSCTETGCPVRTSWVPPAIAGGSSYTPASQQPAVPLPTPVPPASGFSILINNGASETSNWVVKIILNGGPDTTGVQLSADPNFTGISPEPFSKSKLFVLPKGSGIKTVYAKFFNKEGGESATVSASINLKAQTTPVAKAETLPIKPVFTRNLYRGYTGSDVIELQKFLAKDKAVYPQGLVTGYYGQLTFSAVGRFQLKYGVVSSSKTPGFGNVGPLTRAKLNSLVSE